MAPLVLASDGNFYGTTETGGLGLLGTIFKMTPQGDLTTLFNFNGTNGAYPTTALIQGTDGNLYGTTTLGGTGTGGTVFQLNLAPVIPPLIITTIALPQGTNGSVYHADLSASGGKPPYSWSIISGSLPAGLTLSGNGIISGKPLTNGTFNFTVQITNALPTNVTQTLALVINSPIDKQKPYITITSPRPGQVCTNSSFKLVGTAGDNVAVDAVYYSLNCSAWEMASSANFWADWTTNINLTAGNNTVLAAAVDTSGNIAYTSKIIFNYRVMAPIALQIGTNGAVAPNDMGKLLQIGKSYTIKAIPNKGYEFVQWTGSQTSLKPTLNFVMASNLTFTATFAIKP